MPTDTATLLRTLENAAARMLTLGPRKGVVIRAGSHGAYYLPGPTTVQSLHTPHTGEQAQCKALGRWVPPYHPADSTKVVDPTGAGNAFMGALAAALGQGEDLGEGEQYLLHCSTGSGRNPSVPCWSEG